MVTEYQSNQLKVMAQTGSYDRLGGAATGSSHSRRLTFMDLCSLRMQGEPTRRNHVCSNQAHVEKSFRRDGPFDYEKYRHTRVDGNKRKIDKIFAREKDISFLADYIKSVMGGAEFGLCHGTRRGLEQQWFQK